MPSNGFCQQFTTLHTHKLAYTYIYIIVKNIWGSLKSAAKGKIGRAVRTMATMKLSHTTNYWHESEEYEWFEWQCLQLNKSNKYTHTLLKSINTTTRLRCFRWDDADLVRCFGAITDPVERIGKLQSIINTTRLMLASNFKISDTKQVYGSIKSCVKWELMIFTTRKKCKLTCTQKIHQ